MSKNVLHPRHSRFVSVLLTSRSIEDAAAACGVTGRTGRRWMKREDVRAAVHQATGAALAHASVVVTNAMGTALGALLDIIKSESATDAARVSAARATLLSAVKLSQQVSLEERISRLEFALGERKASNGRAT